MHTLNVLAMAHILMNMTFAIESMWGLSQSVCNTSILCSIIIHSRSGQNGWLGCSCMREHEGCCHEMLHTEYVNNSSRNDS